MRSNNLLLKVFSAFSLICLATTPCFAKEHKVLDIQHWKTHNNAQVYFVHSQGLPIVDITVAFDAGSAHDNGDFGLATLTNNMLNLGTKKLSDDAIADAFDTTGAIFDDSTNRDMATVSLRSMTDKLLLKPALNIFAQVITQPNFPKKAYTRLQKRSISAIKMQDQDPGNVASKYFYQHLYGNYPYAHPIMGNVESISRTTLSNVQQFYNRYYVGENAKVIIVGDVTKKQATEIANKVVGKLPKGKPADKLTEVPLNRSAVQNYPYPSEQTHVRMGEIGINWKSPDFFPLYVGNYTLGGGSLVSRLFKTVREQAGLTYDINSRFKPMLANGPFVINLQTINSQAPKAIKMTQQVLQNFITHGPTEQELAAAKSNLIGSFPLRLDSNAAISDYVLLIAYYDLPLDFLDTFRKNIEKVTAKQVQEAFAKHVKMNDLLIVTVGQTPPIPAATTDNANS